MNKRIAIKKGKKVKDKELYNFDRTIAKWMLPRLKQFTESDVKSVCKNIGGKIYY